MRQCTILTMDGQKPTALANLIECCQKSLSGMLGIHFQPYTLTSIHATIIGLEISDPKRMFNRNFLNMRNEKREMDIVGYSQYLSQSSEFPIHIRFGGFNPSQIPFLDQDKAPYERSFGIYSGKAVMVGWPVDKDGSTHSAPRLVQSLERLRKEAAEFKIFHAYHLDNQSVDNAFYFRIGMVSEYRRERVREIESVLGRIVSEIDPIYIPIRNEELYFVSYLEQTLPPDSTMAPRLKYIDAGTIAEYYQDSEDKL